MCVGTPVQLIAVDGLTATGSGAHGIVPIVLALVGPQALGAHVLSHLGTAIRVLEPQEAQAIADAMEAVLCATRGDPFEHLLADLIDRPPSLPPHLAALLPPGDAP